MSADTPLQFVDTNILIYAYDRTTGARHARARTLVKELWRSRRGCVSVQVLQEFYVVGARKLIEIAPADLRVILTDLARWQVHTPTAADVLSAADLHERYQVSFWDAMILQSAARSAPGLPAGLVGRPERRSRISRRARAQPIYHQTTPVTVRSKANGARQAHDDLHQPKRRDAGLYDQRQRADHGDHGCA